MAGVKHFDPIPPAESPSLPSFSIDANTCRNPACDNFGVSAQDIQNPKYGYKYKETNGVLKSVCKCCKQTRTVYSNLSALEAFHRCLAKSIPYASCPNPDCKNHHVNIFEHYYGNLRDRREKLYRINVSDDKAGRYQARCRNCDRTFLLSEPLRLHKSKRRFWQKDIEQIIRMLVDGAGPSNVMNQLQVHPDRYYSHLKAAAHAMLAYNNARTIKLMKKDHAPDRLQVYTDCIVCSLKSSRGNERHHKMKIIVSTCVKNNRSLVLAFHPLFDQQDHDDLDLIEDSSKPLAERRRDYLKHPFNRGKDDPKPLLGVGGLLMDEFYTYLGHFLVLRKLLVNVPFVQFYIDGEANLYNAALNAFSDRIRSEECDIVVRKSEKAKKGEKARTTDKLSQRFERVRSKARRDYEKAYPDKKPNGDQELRRFLLGEEMKRVNQAICASGTEGHGVLFPEHLSKIYKTAISKPNGAGSDYWVLHELNNKYSLEPTRLLWLTRRTKQSNTKHELNLYLGSAIFFIDNVFASFRSRSSMAARPLVTATGHKNYNRSPELPLTLVRDFSVNVAFWNFFLNFRNRNKVTIASVHGLVNKSGSPELRDIFKSRQSFAHAQRMSKWLGI